MSETVTKLYTPRAMRSDSVSIGLHSMLHRQDASVALIFETSHDACGLTSGFHLSAAEARQFAALLIQHADASDGSAS